ncbi:MAG: hypothetical protein MJ219_00365 [Mycoplasmoidaceae bacterium]|nr:hypothetical protein [Mycoplasmoidaceae bacterium]
MKNKKKWSNRLPSYYLVEKINTFKDDQIIHFDLNDKQDETFMNDAIR